MIYHFQNQSHEGFDGVIFATTTTQRVIALCLEFKFTTLSEEEAKNKIALWKEVVAASSTPLISEFYLIFIAKKIPKKLPTLPTFEDQQVLFADPSLYGCLSSRPQFLSTIPGWKSIKLIYRTRDRTIFAREKRTHRNLGTTF